jgi:hypothetical protein
LNFVNTKITKTIHTEPSTEIPALASAQEMTRSTGETANIAGKWQVSWQGKKKSREATMEIQQEDSKLSGSFEAQGGSKPLNGTLQGNRVSRNVGGEKRAINLTGMVEGDKMSGTTEQGSSWSATRPGGNGVGTQTRSRCIGWRRRRWRNAVSAHGKPTSKGPALTHSTHRAQRLRRKVTTTIESVCLHHHRLRTTFCLRT